MHSHLNARLTQKGRLRLMSQHLEHGRSLRELAVEHGNCFAEAFGYSLRCAYRWLARYRSGGPASLAAPPPADRPEAAGTLLHRCQGSQPSRAGATEEPGTQTTDAALPVGATRRPDAHRYQAAGPDPEGGPPHHRRPAAGALLRRRLQQGSTSP
jgi:hypothetical protein